MSLEFTKNIIYNKWLPQIELFPLNYLIVVQYNIALLGEYYTNRKHIYYTNMINAHFTPSQNKDTRYISPPLILPQVYISINECNPKNDINTNTHPIQTQNDIAHIYKKTSRHLIIIPKYTLEWLWKQYKKK